MTRDLLPYEKEIRVQQHERALQQLEAVRERERIAREGRARRDGDARARRAALVSASEADRLRARELRDHAAHLMAKAEERLRFVGSAVEFEAEWTSRQSQQHEAAQQSEAQRREALSLWNRQVGEFQL